MRQRRQITRCPDRALLGDDGQDAFADHSLDQHRDLPGYTRRTAADRQEFQHHHEPHGGRLQRVTNTTAMGQDKVALQPGRVGRCNLDAGKFSKAGVHTINRLLAFSCPRDHVCGPVDILAGPLSQPDRHVRAPDIFQRRQTRGARFQDNHVTSPQKMRLYNGLKPIRQDSSAG